MTIRAERFWKGIIPTIINHRLILIPMIMSIVGSMIIHSV